MKLYEVDSNYVNALETVLRNLIGRSDSKHSAQTLSWDALNNLMKNTNGLGITYQIFSKLNDDNPGIASLISSFDQNKIELATKKQIDQDQQTPVQSTTPKSVDKMAHRVVSKEFGS